MTNNQSNHVLTLLERLARVINNEASVSELKPAQWEALRYFSQANRFSSSPSALTAYMGVTKGTISQTINALERKGLLRKEKGAEDRRAINIALTNDGHKKLKSDPLQGLVDSVAAIPTKKLELFASTLEDLLGRAIDQRDAIPFGVCKTCQFFQRDSDKGAPHLCTLLKVPLSDNDSSLICREHSSAAIPG